MTENLQVHLLFGEGVIFLSLRFHLPALCIYLLVSLSIYKAAAATAAAAVTLQHSTPLPPPLPPTLSIPPYPTLATPDTAPPPHPPQKMAAPE